MQDITFKKATSEDIGNFLALEKMAVDNYTYSGILTEEEVREELETNEVYMIYKDGVLVGSCEYEMKGPDHAYLSGLVIHPDYRGQGIGHAAIKFILEKLKGIKRIDLVTHPHNSKAICIYLKQGFIIESWKDDYYGDGQPRLVLARISKD